VRLLLRVWGFMAANVRYCYCGLKDNAAVRAIRRVHASVQSHESRGCFAANPALSLVHISRVRVGVNQSTYLNHRSHKKNNILSLINLQPIHGWLHETSRLD
jgi:hypothetical protein